MAAPRKMLHFFPGPKVLIWAIDGRPVLKAEGWGGEAPIPGHRDPVMQPQPTTPGKYIIYSYAPYVTRTWEWSRIAWGTRLKLDSTGEKVLYETGKPGAPWADVYAKTGLKKSDIARWYAALYGGSHYRDPDHDGIPEVWLFNDFGPKAVRYFKDKNHNRKKDADEPLSGEMFHTTPRNEAQTALSTDVRLGPSHGCIHIAPSQRDAFKAAGAFDRGTDLTIHPYSADVPAHLR